MPISDDAKLILSARHGDPFAVLGPHTDDAGRTVIRVLLPGAAQVRAVTETASATLEPNDATSLFEGVLNDAPFARYQLHVRWSDGSETVLDDPYRFGPLLTDMDLWLLAEGTHERPFEVLGAHLMTVDGIAGTRFAVWAPNARRASVVGDFNHWDGRRHPMRLRRECGVWEIFLPAVLAGARYKFELLGPDGALLPQKADPYAFAGELRPATASVVAALPPPRPFSQERRKANALDAPMSIYEVHPGSWRRKPEEGNRWLTWDELGDTLIPYARHLGFTHLELMPISEHPFDGSWGYQPIGLYAPTARFGPPEGFARFVARCHDAGIGVLLDWVPAHFPTDIHGLGRFDGTALYEHADPREGFHQDWNTLIYNLGRSEVRNFLVGNALYWLERFGVDGLRVDAVASMLYRDYSRKEGEWIPNHYGGRENIEAVGFLKRLNEVIGNQCAQAVTMAEESTSYPAVSRPTYHGGLGFHYKWNMGWMHDTLHYMARDPVHRKHHHQEMNFGMVYAFTENFVLPLSHDEVVHGKGSILSRMPGDRWQRFANLRAYYGFMFGHPGKKLLFMGAEFAQEREWTHEQSLDWHLLDDPLHAGVQRLVRDLNHMHRETPALHALDFVPGGFEWIDHEDAEQSIYSFVRRAAPKNDCAPSGDQPEGWAEGPEDTCVVVVCNFTPAPRIGFRLGVPHEGLYRERLNTDSRHYGGSDVGTPLGAAEAQAHASHGRPWSIVVNLPPLATLMFEWKA